MEKRYLVHVEDFEGRKYYIDDNGNDYDGLSDGALWYELPSDDYVKSITNDSVTEITIIDFNENKEIKTIKGKFYDEE